MRTCNRIVEFFKPVALVWLAIVCLATVLCTAAVAPRASMYPERTVKVVVPYAPGGPSDLAGRVVAERLSAHFGQSFIVDNKPGANGVIGVQTVTQSAPDGYTLLVHGSAGVTIYQATARQPVFETLRDLSPVTIVTYFDLILCAPPQAPFGDFKGFLEYAKAHPGKISYGSAGIGAMNHVGTEWLKDLAGIDVVHVPYRGDAPVASDLVNGTLGIAFVSSNVALPFIRSGKLQALAVPNMQRLAALPDVPTIAEQGFPTFELRPWAALFGPAKLPAPIIESLGRALKEEMARPEFQQRLVELGMEAGTSTPAELGNIISTTTQQWKQVATKAHIEVE
jgi:tripartite-type tricarboxylate transporter receptor subunit TctC